MAVYFNPYHQLMPKDIVASVQQYVFHLLENELPDDRIFHTYEHTLGVVRAAEEIAEREGISEMENELLMIAAWFHDTGYAFAYEGHETVGQQVASEFLEQRQFPKEKIQVVLELIGATTMPQTPKNLLQKIICDADMGHLAAPNYCLLQEQLRQEWNKVLDLQFSELEWQIRNMAFLENHHYFTDYGKRILNKRKQENLALCKNRLANLMK